MKLSQRCAIHATKMDEEGWYVTANVLHAAGEQLALVEAITMNAKSYRERLEALGLTQERAAELMGYSGRTGQTWAAEGPPKVVAMLLSSIDNAKELEALSCNNS